MKTLSISLPWPPTMNTYWQSLRRGALAGRVIISNKGKTYRKLVEQRFNVPPGWNRSARMGVAITAYPPDRRKRDIDNLLKPLIDSLAHVGAFADDCQIDDLRITRSHIIAEGMVDIVIHQLTEEATHGKEERVPHRRDLQAEEDQRRFEQLEPAYRE